MSWFSNPFTTSLRPSETHQNDSDDAEEDEPSHTKGVKEDLSELSKTFSRQLWGVASFLAPPPQASHHDSSSDDADDEASLAPPSKLRNESSDDGHDEASMAPLRHDTHICSFMAPTSIDDVDDEASLPLHSHSKPGGHHLITNDGAASMPDANEEPSLHPRHIEQDAELSKELVDVDFEDLMDETVEDPAETLKRPLLSQIKRADLVGQDTAHGFTGISRDLAELKGSMASGFSRILKVVREEVGEEEDSKSHKNDSNEDEEIADDPAGSMHARKLQGINMFFRPLFSNIVHDVRGKTSLDRSSTDDKEEEAYEDSSIGNYTHQISSRAHAFKEAEGRERNLQVVGITEEVLAFARNISMHPETWLDSPLLAHANEDYEFELSVAQKEHVRALELNIARLAALRTELCPDCMSEGFFWKIYFVLLHSRLHKMDAVILSTPKIMEARALLLQKLHEEGEVQEIRTQSISKGKDAVGMTSSTETVSLQLAVEVQANDFGQLEDVETDAAEDVQNKRVLVNTIKLASSNYKGNETDADHWLHEEPLANVQSTASGSRNEDDVSFSDLEEEDEPTSKTVERSDSTQSFGWVQLNKNQSEEDFGGLRAFEKAGLGGSRHEDVGAAQDLCSHSSAQASRKQDQSESSDWSTVEEDDAASADFM